jgi:hypothetical protein
MRRRNACLIGLTLTLLSAASVRGQEPASKSLASSLPCKQKWARFVVVRGRVMVFITRGQGAAAWTEESPGGVGETFGVHYQPGTLLVRYDVSAPDQQLVIQFHGPRHLTIERKPGVHGQLAALTFEQPETGPVRFTLGDGQQRRQWEAPSLWHLLLVERDVTREHLVPVLQLLRLDWLNDDCWTTLVLARCRPGNNWFENLPIPRLPCGSPRIGNCARQVRRCCRFWRVWTRPA